MSSMLCGIMASFYNQIILLAVERPPSAESFEPLVVETSLRISPLWPQSIPLLFAS
jgi:hypothetical protein